MQACRVPRAFVPARGAAPRRHAARCICRASSRHPSETELVARRAVLAAGPAALLAAAGAAQADEERFLESDAAGPPGDATVTDRVFLDIGLCPEGVRSDRKLGDKTILCKEPEPMGRLVIDLYGNAAPGTVANFKALIAAGSLNGTCFSKIIPGQWLVAGQQGPRRSGLLEAPPGLPPNPDTLNAAAFRLRHNRPGTLSLNLSENEDDQYLRNAPGYRNLSFLITTGPGLAYSLDGENIVFGAVAEGMDVVDKIAQVPVFLPDGNLRAFNDLARFIGDERAGKSRAKWNKPLKAVVIVDSGSL